MPADKRHVPISDACRAYHYKCKKSGSRWRRSHLTPGSAPGDDELPACNRCARAGRDCVRPTQYRFRDAHADTLQFSNVQVWLDLPQRVDFVDETSALEDEYAGPETKRQRPNTRTFNPKDDASLGFANVGIFSRASASTQTIPHTPSTPSTLKGSPGPGRTAQDADLIRHFVDNVAHYFDFCDPRRHFALIVPQKARKNNALACAVLALSARHLNRLRPTECDPFVADMHYHTCCEQLIPALADNAAVTDDSLLAATVILRFLEELDVPITGDDLQSHLIGTQAIVSAQEELHDSDQGPSGLREAANWAAFRQDLYMALTSLRPMQLRPISQPSEMNEGDWANRAVLLCGEALRFAYGQHSDKMDAYRMVLHANEDWERDKPPSFDPFFSGMAEDMGLPKIRFLADWHVMGHMYNQLAHLLLAVHRPEVPQAGLGDTQATNMASEDAKRIVWTMAGMAIYNPHAPAAMLVASMAIAMCGHLFDSPREQDRLFQVLVDTDVTY